MKRLNITFFISAAALLTKNHTSGISIFGTISDNALPANTTHWFDTSIIVDCVDAQSLGKLLTAIDSMECDDGAVGAISRISISKEREQIRLKATVVRYGPLTPEQLRKLVCSDSRDYFNDWVTK